MLWSAIAMMALLVGIIAWRLAVDEIRRSQSLRVSVQYIAQGYADEISTRVRIATSTAWSLGTFVSQVGDDEILQEGVFARIAGTMIAASSVGIRSLQLAPNGTVSLIAPLTEDRGALGHALLVDPMRRQGVLDTIAAFPGRLVTTAGPLQLVQGGVGLLGRSPIFSVRAPEYLDLPPWTDKAGITHEVDCSTAEMRKRNCRIQGPDELGKPTFFWGLATMLMDIDRLVESAVRACRAPFSPT